MLLYETSFEAENDLQGVVNYTLERYGLEQMKKYIAELEKCAKNLAQKQGYFHEIKASGTKVRVKHCQHHYIFGYEQQDTTFLVIAVFHEKMDLMKRLKNRLP